MRDLVDSEATSEVMSTCISQASIDSGPFRSVYESMVFVAWNVTSWELCGSVGVCSKRLEGSGKVHKGIGWS